jgi:hypothetical protein
MAIIMANTSTFRRRGTTTITMGPMGTRARRPPTSTITITITSRFAFITVAMGMGTS